MTFTGKFMKTMEGWMVAVNTGVPKIGDEVRVRKADKSVTTVMVKSVSTESGKAICTFVERRTESAYSIQNLSRDIRPAEYPIDARRANRAAQAQFDREYDPSDIDDQLSGMRYKGTDRRAL